MYWDHKDKKYLEKIYQNVLSRKSPYFRRNLAINGNPTDINVIKVKKDDSFLEKFGGLSSIDENVCFLIEHINNFDTFLFNMNVDIIFLDVRFIVLKVLKNVAPDNLLDSPKKTRNIIVFRTGSIDFYNIKNNDVVNTKS